ncbi:trypsin-like serine protease [Halobacteriovorax sp. CON-3]|uniref:trypsin-like serine protease n=1 Tax=Halobacteriovorax sp. CON-3 TaxID=3157710 RepID=UPI0037176F62
MKKLLLGLVLLSLNTYASLGGEEVYDYQFMRVGTVNGCKAVLLEDDVAITAAHCVVGGANEFLFHMKLYDGRNLSADWIPVKNIVIHPKYNSKKKKTYDLALIFLKRVPSESIDYFKKAPLELNKKFLISNDSSAPLMLLSQLSNGQGGVAPWYLSEVKLKKNFKNRPANSYLPAEDNKVCPGDSGAPIFSVTASGEYQLHALVSGGTENLKYFIERNYRNLRGYFVLAPQCDDVLKTFYAVPLARHLDWINATIKSSLK